LVCPEEKVLGILTFGAKLRTSIVTGNLKARSFSGNGIKGFCEREDAELAVRQRTRPRKPRGSAVNVVEKSTPASRKESADASLSRARSRQSPTQPPTRVEIVRGTRHCSRDNREAVENVGSDGRVRGRR
jgi:hypothetical protein